MSPTSYHCSTPRRFDQYTGWRGRARKYDALHSALVTTRPSSVTVYSSRGDALEGVIAQAGWTVARERLAAFGPEDLRRQQWFIRAALGSLPGAPEPGRVPTPED